ncbi:hypothetical protein [Candidatus Protochlamydia phocaeensis]|uniref:hypothetical protein n=1 Tax=Candidatus Protochlamydia phocaeensis TaxID=1414722 RepID=UPI000838BF9B|nr:hypothetical protein [Candidatus Protochlamydia phocaeensis]
MSFINMAEPDFIHPKEYLTEELEKIKTKQSAIRCMQSMPSLTLHGYPYKTWGNSSFGEAQLCCFSDIHKMASVEKQEWEFLEQVSTPQDLILLEGFPAGKQARESTNPQIKKVILTTCTRGWDDTALFEEQYNCHEKEEGFIKNYLAALDKSFNDKSLISFCQQEELKNFAKRWQSKSLKHLYFITRKYPDKFLTPENLSWLYSSLKEALYVIGYKIERKNLENTEKTFQARQKSLFKTINQFPARKYYIIAGLHHFPNPLNEKDPTLEETRIFFNKRRYCVLIPQKVLDHLEKIYRELENQMIKALKHFAEKLI